MLNCVSTHKWMNGYPWIDEWMLLNDSTLDVTQGFDLDPCLCVWPTNFCLTSPFAFCSHAQSTHLCTPHQHATTSITDRLLDRQQEGRAVHPRRSSITRTWLSGWGGDGVGMGWGYYTLDVSRRDLVWPLHGHVHITLRLLQLDGLTTLPVLC